MLNALASAAPLLACPTPQCGRGPLTLADKALSCPVAHSFDVAKQGYVNLLGQRRTASDTVDMVTAREGFLGAGHYEPIRSAVAHACYGTHRVLEAGAGTGYYLAGVLHENPDALGIATDLSVPASKRAAKAHPRMAAVVADTWAGLPIADGVLDAVCCVFAPRNATEFARVLRPEGRLVVVHPTAEHLQPLREEAGLLGVQAGKEERVIDSLGAQFELTKSVPIRFHLALDRPDLAQLIGMGPNAFHDRGRTLPLRANVLISVLVQSFSRLSSRGLDG